MSSTQTRRTSLWLFAAFLTFGGCEGCPGCGSDVLARLSDAHGDVTRDFSASQNQWTPAAVGAEFKLGDAVRTAADGDAVVSLSEGGGLRLEANTIVRFLDQAPDDPNRRVEVEMGAARVEAGESGLSVVAGAAGFARVASGSRVRVTTEDTGVQLQVEFGSAQIERVGEDILTLQTGEFHVFSIEMGEAVFETEETDAGADAAPDADAEVDAEVEVPEVAVSFRGRVEIQDADGEWERLARGTDAIPAGARVRVPRGGRLQVSRGNEAATLRGPAEGTVAAGAALLRVTGGTVNANATSADITVAVPGGTIISRAGGSGSRVDIRLQRGDAVVDARTGSAQLQGTQNSHLLRFGETATLTAEGRVDTGGNAAPARAHVAISAGSSAIIHDPSAPVAVRIRFGGQCPGEGVVELSRGRSFRRPSARSFGAGSANVLVAPGSNSYRVRCVTEGTPSGAAVAQGSINVQRDSGRARLPVRPSRVPIDTDGRRYTVLYQNRLPIVMIRWPDAPEAGSYIFNFQPARGAAIRNQSGSPRFQLESGQVGEGTHQIWFEAPGASPSRSPRTTLSVRYDLAASAVFLREPSGSTVSPGTVQVSGQALDGWSVSVGGAELPLDNAYRFSGSASTPSDVDALAIRLVHPRHGVHYYLRRINR